MSEYTRKVKNPPKRLVSNGMFEFGTYDAPFEIVNPLDAVKPLSLRLPKFLKNMRLKEWEAFQIGNKDFFILTAVYNSKGLGVVQFIVIDLKKEQKYIFQKFLPFWKMNVARSLMNTVTCSYGCDYSFHIHNNLKNDRIFFNFWSQGKNGNPDMSCRFEAFHENETCKPIVICQPFDENRALYSHKALMPMSGKLTIGEDNYEFNKSDSFVIMDDHKGYYPFEMIYDWVTTAGYDNKNRLIGFNLTDNQIKEPEKYNENCLWIDGDMQVLPPVTIKRPDGIMSAWIIKDNYNRVNLKFLPKFDGRININFLIFKTKYYAPYGFFSGYILDKNDNKIIFDNYFGMGEKKYIKA